MQQTIHGFISTLFKRKKHTKKKKQQQHKSHLFTLPNLTNFTCKKNTIYIQSYSYQSLICLLPAIYQTIT